MRQWQKWQVAVKKKKKKKKNMGEWQWMGGSGMSGCRMSVRFEWYALESVSVKINPDMPSIRLKWQWQKMAGGSHKKKKKTITKI
jgi:hypothetical protein